jgi:hypothetical protein
VFNVGGQSSGYLSINTDRSDDEMNVSIVSPVCGDNFDDGDATVNVEVVASDSDDEISGTLTIGGVDAGVFGNGGVVISGYDFSPGNVQVVADAVNSRGKRSRSVSSVMVLDFPYVDGKEYVAACIDKPKDYMNFDGSVVEFDASTSRAIEIVGGVPDVIKPSDLDGRLSWNWTFYPGGIVRSFSDNTNPLAYKFTAEFPVAGENSATLRLELF